MSPELIALLGTSSAALLDMLRIAEAFLRRSGTVNLPASSAAGPTVFTIGGTPALTTIPLSQAELDALAKGMAEAGVKEKAISFLQGLFTGIMVAA